MGPLEQIANYPSDATIVARGFCTPYMNENSLHKEVTNLKVDTDSDTNTSDQNNFSNVNQTCNSRPLPPVPH